MRYSIVFSRVIVAKDENDAMKQFFDLIIDVDNFPNINEMFEVTDESILNNIIYKQDEDEKWKKDQRN